MAAHVLPAHKEAALTVTTDTLRSATGAPPAGESAATAQAVPDPGPDWSSAWRQVNSACSWPC